jgi:hypothetical protein
MPEVISLNGMLICISPLRILGTDHIVIVGQAGCQIANSCWEVGSRHPRNTRDSGITTKEESNQTTADNNNNSLAVLSRTRYPGIYDPALSAWNLMCIMQEPRLNKPLASHSRMVTLQRNGRLQSQTTDSTRFSPRQVCIDRQL